MVQRFMQTMLLAAAVLATPPVRAGDLYGNVRDERGDGVEGAEVKVTVGEATFTGTTGAGGFYRIRVRPTGAGRLTVERRGRESSAIGVYSFPNSVRWDFRIGADGRLRRE